MDWVDGIKTRLTKAIAELEERSFAFGVFMAATQAFNRHYCTQLAAGISYYAIFSLFPLLLGLIALASLFLQSADAQNRIIGAASQFLPTSTQLVRQNIQQVLLARGTIGLVAAIGLLWSAQAVFSSITTSLNIAWGVREKRPFWELTGIQLILVLGAGVFIAASLALTYLLALISSSPIPVIGPALDATPFWVWIAELVSAALNIIAFLFVYRYLPCAPLRLRDVWHGAVFAGVVFEIAKVGYVFYSTHFANYRLAYGSLAAIIALLFWAWLSSCILLFGAEITAQYAKAQWPGYNGDRE